MGAGTPDSNDLGFVGLWMLANISFVGMRAQNSPRKVWRIIVFIFGFPGTLISFWAVKEGGERAYGIDLPRRAGGHSFQELKTNDPHMSSRRDMVLAWLTTVVFCLYCVYTFVSLYLNTKNLVHLYSQMGIEMPFSTTFVVASWPGLYLAILGGSGIFVAIKEFFVEDKKRSLIISLIVAIFVVLIVDWTNMALFLPFTRVIEKLAH